MSSSQIPADSPPPYSQDDPVAHKTRNGIPPEHRRSMEDESRELPPGWVRQFDAKNGHQFFVDTKANPPRSIWCHPYDDEQFLSTQPSAERERIQTLHRVPTDADVIAESSDDDHDPRGPPQRVDSHPSGMKRFGRKVKDKVTSSTHQQRQDQRSKRAEEEKRAYEKHILIRQAMAKAIQTGEPQKIGRDKEGNDLYLSPPRGLSGSQSSYGGRVIDPYSSGPYYNPTGRYYNPPTAYRRPYGYGYGGGYGLPLLGGLGGGLLLGSALGGMGGLGMGGMGMGMGGMGMGMGGGMGGGC